MRFSIILACAAYALVGNASAIMSPFDKRASPAQKDAAAQLVLYAKDAKDAALSIRLEQLELDQESSNHDGSVRINAIKISIAQNQRRFIDAGEKAIRYALIAYDIVPVIDRGMNWGAETLRPIRPVGISVMPDFKGKKITWYPVVREDEARKNIYKQSKDGESAKYKNGGATTFAGISTIFEGAFESPDELAITLYHEKEHFAQYTTPGRGDKTTQDGRESEAWQAEKKIYADIGIAGDELVHRYNYADKKIHDHEAADKKIRGKNMFDRAFWGFREKEPAFLEPGSSREIEANEKLSNDFDGIVANEISAIRQRKEDMRWERILATAKAAAARSKGHGQSEHEPDSPYVSPRVVMEDSQMPSVAMEEVTIPDLTYDLASIAQKACANPGSMTQADMLKVEAALTGYGLSGCAKELYENLSRVNKTLRNGEWIRADWVNGQAREIAQRNADRQNPAPNSHNDGRAEARHRPYLGPCGNAGSNCLHH